MTVLYLDRNLTGEHAKYCPLMTHPHLATTLFDPYPAATVHNILALALPT